MQRDPDAGFGLMLLRAIRKRCVRCGGPKVFRTFGELHERCPQCGFRFERESGYWVGAMIINTAVTFAALLTVLVVGMVVTWPEVPWTPVFVATVLVAGVVPIVFYPISKTSWQAIELSYHRLEEDEITDALEYLARRSSQT